MPSLDGVGRVDNLLQQLTVQNLSVLGTMSVTTINTVPYGADPVSAVNGDLWLNSSTFALSWQANSATARLALTPGKTVTLQNRITFAGTDATTMTFPATTTTVAGLGITQTFTGQQTFSNAGGIIIGGAGVGLATLAYANSATSRALTLPDPGAADTLAVLGATQTFSGQLTLSNTANAITATTFTIKNANVGGGNPTITCNSGATPGNTLFSGGLIIGGGAFISPSAAASASDIGQSTIQWRHAYVRSTIEMRTADGDTNPSAQLAPASLKLGINSADNLSWVMSVTTSALATITGSITVSGTVNNLTLTQPATAATLTLANNSSFITSGAFNTTITATATTNSTLPSGTHTLAGLDVVQAFTAAQTFSSAINVNVTATSGAAGYTIAAGDYLVAFNSTAASQTVTLPSAGAGKRVIILKNTGATNTFTATRAGTDTINTLTTLGATTTGAIAINGGTLTLISDGTSVWHQVV